MCEESCVWYSKMIRYCKMRGGGDGSSPQMAALNCKRKPSQAEESSPTPGKQLFVKSSPSFEYSIVLVLCRVPEENRQNEDRDLLFLVS